MRFQRLLFVVAFAGGCDFSSGDVEDTGNLVGSNMPAYCAEDLRSAVADTSVASDGFAFSADDAIAAMAGTFAGELVTYDANGEEAARLPMTLTLAAGAVEAVSTVLVDPGSDGGSDSSDPPMGAPESEPDVGGCAPFYEISASGQLTAGDGLLDEAVTVKIHVTDVANGAFNATIALADLHGSVALPTEITPSEWDAVALSVDAYTQDGAWTGSVMWQASNDDSEDTYTYDTATGVGTGTVGVAGMSATVGTFSLARP